MDRRALSEECDHRAGGRSGGEGQKPRALLALPLLQLLLLLLLLLLLPPPPPLPLPLLLLLLLLLLRAWQPRALSACVTRSPRRVPIFARYSGVACAPRPQGEAHGARAKSCCRAARGRQDGAGRSRGAPAADAGALG
jgi:hypothetical protein